MVKTFSKMDQGVREVLFGDGKIELASWSRTEWTPSIGRECSKKTKIFTSESISETAWFDQSEPFTCKIFQFIDFSVFPKISHFCIVYPLINGSLFVFPAFEKSIGGSKPCQCDTNGGTLFKNRWKIGILNALVEILVFSEIEFLGEESG